MKFDCKALVCCSIWRVCFYAGVKCTLVGSTAGGWKSMKGTVFALFGDDWLCLMKDTGLYRAGRGKLHRKVCEYTQRFSGFLFVNCKSYTEIPTCSLLALTAQYKIYMLCKIPQERKKKKSQEISLMFQLFLRWHLEQTAALLKYPATQMWEKDPLKLQRRSQTVLRFVKSVKARYP